MEAEATIAASFWRGAVFGAVCILSLVAFGTWASWFYEKTQVARRRKNVIPLDRKY